MTKMAFSLYDEMHIDPLWFDISFVEQKTLYFTAYFLEICGEINNALCVFFCANKYINNRDVLTRLQRDIRPTSA